MTEAVDFEREPLRFLDEIFPEAGDAAWADDRQLLVGEAVVARKVLVNAEGEYRDQSDFFHTRRGPVGTREQQVAIGRAATDLIRNYLRAHAGELEQAIARTLVPDSDWPDAGNWLVYRHVAPILISPERPQRLHRTVEAIVTRAVLAGARQRHPWLSRMVFRRRAMAELKRAVTTTRRAGDLAPRDVLAAIVTSAGPGVDADDLAEIFLSFLFAIAGSVGFALGWSLFLLGRHPGTEAPPAWVVREALRLWPVAWLLGRQPARRHEVAGVAVDEDDDVVVCPYAVHRNPRHWHDPDSFRPERWGEQHDASAFLPFGWGPRRCVGASSAMRLVEDILTIFDRDFTTTITIQDESPQIAAALAPPRFSLRLQPSNSLERR